MSIKKIKTKDGNRYEVSMYTAGLGSKRLRRRFDKKIEAQEFLQNYMANTFNYKKGSHSLSLLEEVRFCDEALFWLVSNQSHFSSSHLKRVKGVLKEILPNLGNLTMDNFTAKLLSQFQQEQLKNKLTNATVNRKTEVICAILNHSVNNLRIPYNPSRGFKKLPIVKDEVCFWSKSDALHFLRFANQKYCIGSKRRWIYTVYLLALNTGLRAGEIWGLQKRDIQAHSLFIRRQFNSVTQDFSIIKGKRNTKSGILSRHAPCNEDLKSELLPLIMGKLENDVIFTSLALTPIDHNNFRRIFLRDIKESGLPEIRFHDLRHTAATLMISEGIDIKTVQSILGHEDIKTTMNYVHLIGDNIKKVAMSFRIAI